MKPLLLLAAALAALPVRAEPRKSPCNPWAGSATVWTHYDEQTGKIRPMTLRECGGAPKGALSYARRCMDLFGNKLKSKKHVVIGDFSTGGDFVRLWVLDWNQIDPEASVPLLRGGLANGDGNQGGQQPQYALDQMDSAATPGGCMRLFGTGDAGTMQTAGQGLQAYKLDGLETQNSCAWQRGIHFHEGYQQNGVDKIMTKRVEDVTADDPTAADFGRVVKGRNLTTATTPGCVTLSNDDYDHIKASGIVPDPGPGWKPGTPPRAQEGILFVSWFWGDNDDGRTIVSRFTAPPRSCGRNAQPVWSAAVPSANGYQKALDENERRKRAPASGDSFDERFWPR